MVGDWHLVHLGSRAVGGAGLVMAEATAISAEGRISPADTGIWKDEQVEAWRPIARFVASHGAVPGIQLAHAGWKGSTAPPWRGGKAVPTGDGGWQPLGVGDEPFTDGYPIPRRMTEQDIDRVCIDWRNAALRALDAGFRVIEIHAAHGYLLHSFLSPLSNRRSDDYGGPFENRARLVLRVAAGPAGRHSDRRAAFCPAIVYRLGRGGLVPLDDSVAASERCSGMSALTSSTVVQEAQYQERRSPSAPDTKRPSPRRSAIRPKFPRRPSA